MTRKKSSFPWGLVALIVVVGGGWWIAQSNDLFSGEPAEELLGAEVQRGPLRISVVQRGNLEAKNSVKITSEIEGQTTILSLVPEGTQVKEGDQLVLLDDSDQRDRRDSQQITVHNNEASFTKAKQQYEIQDSQNDSDIAAAKQRVEFAQTDLIKYTEGDWPRQLQEAEEAIVLAQEEEVSAKDRLEWSRSLSERGFLTRTELERDELSFQRSGILLEQAKRKKDLLIRYDHPKQEAVLHADVEEAKRELERVELQARARLVDFEAAMRTSEARFKLEQEKLRKLDEQIAKARILSPAEGIVVYSREGGGRYGSDDPMRAGKSVREREEILTIPREGGMIAEASVHETVLEQVKTGLRCILRIDALPGREFRGEVAFVALLPDKQSWWANPNQRLYKTEIALLDGTDEMRPGMSCSIEILIDELQDVIYAPVQSIFLDGGETLCFVAKGGDSERRAVEVGASNDKWVEVRSGLSEGEVVLLSAPRDFTPTDAREDTEEEGAEDTHGEQTPQSGPKEGRSSSGRPPVAGAGHGDSPRGSGRPSGGKPKGSAASAGAEHGSTHESKSK